MISPLDIFFDLSIVINSIGSFKKEIFLLINLDNFSAIGFKVRFAIIFPLGLPICEIIIIFAFFSIKKFIVGKTFSILEDSVIIPLFIGTLKK